MPARRIRATASASSSLVVMAAMVTSVHSVGSLRLTLYLGTWEVQNFLGSKVNFLGFLGIFLSNGRYFLGSLRRARLRMPCLRQRDPRDVLSNVKERLFSIDGTLAQNAAQFDLIR